MLNGYLTRISGIASLAIGVGTILVAVGQAAVSLINGESFDWPTFSATCKTAMEFIVAGAAVFGLGRKLEKQTAAVVENTKVTTQAMRKL